MEKMEKCNEVDRVRRTSANDNTFAWNRWDNLPEGYRLYSSPETVKDLRSTSPSLEYRSKGRRLKWDEEKEKWVRVRSADRAIFDTAQEQQRLVDEHVDWSPPRIRGPKGVPVFRFGLDGPSDDHRIRAGQAWYSSHHYRGQLDAGRKDWPLAKVLRAESNNHCLALAERYRILYDAVHNPVELAGKDLADNVYIMVDLRLDESTGNLVDKGVKQVNGKKTPIQEIEPKRAINADPDRTKKRAKPMPKRWNGDWLLLHKIDSSRELAGAQSMLGFLREAFESAVVWGDTLETIGRRHGVGNEAGAKGAGRSLVMLGMQAVDEFWRKPVQRAA